MTASCISFLITFSFPIEPIHVDEGRSSGFGKSVPLSRNREANDLISFDNNFCGIHTNFACNNIISGNKLTNNSNGITLYQDSRFNQISGNNISNNKEYGIFIYTSGLNKMLKNNFIENGKKNAKFLYYIWFLKINIWDENYWNEPRTNPYFIFGKLSVWSIFGLFPCNVNLQTGSS